MRMIVMIITVIGILTRPKDKIQQNIETVVSVFTKSSLYMVISARYIEYRITNICHPTAWLSSSYPALWPTSFPFLFHYFSLPFLSSFPSLFILLPFL